MKENKKVVAASYEARNVFIGNKFILLIVFGLVIYFCLNFVKNITFFSPFKQYLLNNLDLSRPFVRVLVFLKTYVTYEAAVVLLLHDILGTAVR